MWNRDNIEKVSPSPPSVSLLLSKDPGSLSPLFSSTQTFPSLGDGSDCVLLPTSPLCITPSPPPILYSSSSPSWHHTTITGSKRRAGAQGERGSREQASRRSRERVTHSYLLPPPSSHSIPPAHWEISSAIPLFSRNPHPNLQRSFESASTTSWAPPLLPLRLLTAPLPSKTAGTRVLTSLRASTSARQTTVHPLHLGEMWTGRRKRRTRRTRSSGNGAMPSLCLMSVSDGSHPGASGSCHTPSLIVEQAIYAVTTDTNRVDASTSARPPCEHERPPPANFAPLLFSSSSPSDPRGLVGLGQDNFSGESYGDKPWYASKEGAGVSAMPHGYPPLFDSPPLCFLLQSLLLWAGQFLHDLHRPHCTLSACQYPWLNRSPPCRRSLPSAIGQGDGDRRKRDEKLKSREDPMGNVDRCARARDD